MDNETGLVLYDALSAIGGAEKVTLELLDMYPRSQLATGYVNWELFPDLESGRVFPIAQKVALNHPWLRAIRLILAFRRLGKSGVQHQWALFSGIFAPAASLAGIARRNVMYCHAIPRLCFDLRDYYLAQAPGFLRPGVGLFMWLVENNFRCSLQRMDVVLCNSTNVQRDLLKYFGCESRVVYPPIRNEQFRWIDAGIEYVSVARLEPLKRVKSIVEAFLMMPERRLVVASGGSEERALRQLAQGAENISFTGWLSDRELRRRVGSARAVIYLPVNEDFGMAPVEAMAAGKPVIGVAEGGLLETVVNGETGLLIAGEPTPAAIRVAVDQLEDIGPLAMRERCQQRARLFSRERFVAGVADALDGGA